MDWPREGAIPNAPIWACPPCYVRGRIQYEKEPVLNQTDFERIEYNVSVSLLGGTVLKRVFVPASRIFLDLLVMITEY